MEVASTESAPFLRRNATSPLTPSWPKTIACENERNATSALMNAKLTKNNYMQIKDSKMNEIIYRISYVYTA